MGLKTRLAYLATHYGLRHQLDKLQEELCELDEAIDEHRQFHNPYTKTHVAEELADVYVVARQIMYLMDIHVSEMVDRAEFKTDRQMWRLKRQKEWGDLIVGHRTETFKRSV